MPSARANGIAETLLATTVEAHGGKRYDTAHFGFQFRDKNYTFKNSGSDYTYTVSSRRDGKTTEDELTQQSFTRKINGNVEVLTTTKQALYGASLNSVIYFATLPHKLLDPAVNLAYKGTTNIKSQNYQTLMISFDEEGGGQDHDDEYYYWINDETKLIDYFAYNYLVSGGGVRFRSAYNTRKVAGVVFQDYINYKAPVGTALSELPALFEKDQLKKLSVIATENVVNLSS